LEAIIAQQTYPLCVGWTFGTLNHSLNVVSQCHHVNEICRLFNSSCIHTSKKRWCLQVHGCW